MFWTKKLKSSETSPNHKIIGIQTLTEKTKAESPILGAIDPSIIDPRTRGATDPGASQTRKKGAILESPEPEGSSNQQAMPPTEEEEQAVSDDDDEFDGSDGDDSEMDVDEDEPPPTQPTHSEPNPSAAFPSPNPNPNHALVAPQNGSIITVPAAGSQPARVVLAMEARQHAAAAADDSRRLFQRLWTDEDEITILKGFLEFTMQRGTTHASHQYDTGPFYEQIRKQLPMEFNKNQLIEKLRRLKKKYRNVVGRMVSGKEFAFRSAHEQATFEISRRIWSAGVKRAGDSDEDEFIPNPTSALVEFDPGLGDGTLISERRLSRSSQRRIRRRAAEEEASAAAAAAEAAVAAAAATGVAVEVPIASPPAAPLSAPIPSIIEETVKSCLSPLFKELLHSAMAGSSGGFMPAIGINGVGLYGVNPLQLGLGSLQGKLPEDEKWRKQHILELEVYLQRIELIRDQIKSKLEELKSMTPSAGV